MFKIVSEAQLGTDIKFDSVTGKLILNMGTSLVRDGSGKIGVDVAASGIKVKSDDAGNIISLGTDTGAMLTADNIKVVVGEMVAAATDGIDYDTLTKTLKAYMASLAVVDSNSIDLTVVADGDGDGTDGDVSLKADVKVSAKADNRLSISAVSGEEGLLVDKAVITTAVVAGAVPVLTITVDGTSKDQPLEEIQDTAGNTLGYLIKA